MEIEESDLAEVIERHQMYELSMDHMTTIMYNLLCSVNYLHSANLIHRDLKPGNILLNFECIPKLCDFGLTRSLPKNTPDYTKNIPPPPPSKEISSSSSMSSTGSPVKSVIVKTSNTKDYRTRKSMFLTKETVESIKLPAINEPRNQIKSDTIKLKK